MEKKKHLVTINVTKIWPVNSRNGEMVRGVPNVPLVAPCPFSRKCVPLVSKNGQNVPLVIKNVPLVSKNVPLVSKNVPLVSKICD